MTISREDKESEPLYWLGKPINAMTREELQHALIDANKIIIDQRDKVFRLQQLEYDDEFNC